MLNTVTIRASIFVLVCAIALSAHAMADTSRKVNVPAGELTNALRILAEQSGVEFVYSADQLKGVRTMGVRGEFTTEKAVAKLLEGTALQVTTHESGAILISQPPVARPIEKSTTSLAPIDSTSMLTQNEPTPTESASSRQSAESTPNNSRRVEELPEVVVKDIPEILVVGSRSLNVDIQRTRDDVQPYVVINRSALERSGAANVEDYLRSRLPMNAQAASLPQLSPAQSDANTGQINLRGLGSNQTLILVDGRPLPPVANGFAFSQPNINGIPVSAIERIEVLPATAGGIYGGNATGGVVNIILKRDFSGIQIDLLYGSAFEGDARRGELGAAGAWSLNDGRTHITMFAHHGEQKAVYQNDRGFIADGWRRFAGFAPDYYLLQSLFGSAQNVFSLLGDDLTLDAGGDLGSPFTSVPEGYKGGDGGAGLAGNAGKLRLDDPRYALYQAPTSDAVNINLRQKVSQHIEVFLDLARETSRSESAPSQGTTLFLASDALSNPFEQDVFVNVPLGDLGLKTESRSETTRIDVGLIARLGAEWSASLEVGRSQNRARAVGEFLSSLTPVGETKLEEAAFSDLSNLSFEQDDFFAATSRFGDAVSKLDAVVVRAGGPVTDLPAGPIAVSLSLEGRSQNLDEIFSYVNFPPFFEQTRWFPSESREIRSAYVEARLPFVSAQNDKGWADELELMAALRYDEYETRVTSGNAVVPSQSGPFPDLSYERSDFDSANYTVGLRYKPFADLALRASFGTGFLPPDLYQLRSLSTQGPPDVLFPEPLFDPRRGGTPLEGDPGGSPPGLITLLTGGGRHVLPEDSKSFSFGLVYQPSFIDGLRFSADYIYIEKSNELRLLFDQEILNNEALFPGRVTRASPQDGDPPDWAGPVIALDSSVVNLARTEVSAIDVQVDYTKQLANLGEVRFYSLASWQPQFARRVFADDAFIDAAGFADGPLKWRGNCGIDWRRGRWSAGWNAQYFDSYLVYGSDPLAARDLLVSLAGSSTVPSQTYHDGYLRYAFGDDPGASAITLGIQNIADHDPPFSGLLGYSGYGDPRGRRFTIALRAAF